MPCPHDQRAVPIWGSCDLPVMCLRAMGLRFFNFCHGVELNKIVEAAMPLNPYDDSTISLQKPYRNGDLTSYVHRKLIGRQMLPRH